MEIFLMTHGETWVYLNDSNKKGLFIIENKEKKKCVNLVPSM